MITTSFTTYFNTSTKKFRVEDTTNYQIQGVDPVNVKGVIKLTSPRGITYNNVTWASPDISPNTSVYSAWIALPQNQSGYILAGTYKVQYSIQILGVADAVLENTYTYNFVIPAIDITQDPDGYNSTFSSVDDTVYGTYTSLVRTHTVTPPSGSGLPTTSNTSATISYAANIWSGEWSTQITSVLVYTQADSLVINCTITDTDTINVYNVNMDTIRGYINVLRLRYIAALGNDRDEAYRIKDKLLLIDTAYVEYDLALYYSELEEAYDRGVNIIEQLNDYVTITTEEITPFSQSQGTAHVPVSISGAYAYGTTINASSQVMSFSLATTGHGGMMPQLSGNVTDYLTGAGTWIALPGGGDAMKTDFASYTTVTAITTTDVLHWTTAYNWGNHASGGYMVAASYPDLTAIEVLAGTSGFLKKTALNTWTLDTSTYLSGTKVDTFNTRSGAVTLTKADVESVLTGTITSHTHAYQASDSTLTSIAAISFVTGDTMYASGTDTLTRLAKGTSLQLYRMNTGATAPEWWTPDYITANQTITLSGDATGTGTTAIAVTIAASGASAGTYKSVTVNTKGLVTAGTNPTTILGYGITDALTTAHAANNIIDTGLGDQFLADDGTYKSVLAAGVSDRQIVFSNGTTFTGSNDFIFDSITSTVYLNNLVVDNCQIDTEITFTGASSNSGSGSGSGFRGWSDVSIKRSADNLIFEDRYVTKTLSQLAASATNYWSANGSDIYYGTTSDAFKVGINQENPTAEIEVGGHIIADYFDSNYFRYKNSNILIGPNAGDDEDGSNLLYIHNSATENPLIYGDFLNNELVFNADVYINTVKRLAFGDSTVSIRRDGSNNLEFVDLNANGGSPILLSDLVIGDLTDYALKTDFISYVSVNSITAANLVTWGKASILTDSGSGDSYLSNDGTYKVLSNVGNTTTLYLHNEVSDISGYEKLLNSPNNAAEDVDVVAVTSGTSPVLIDDYATEPSYPGITAIPAGLWTFKTWAKVDSAVGTTTITIRVYKYATDTTETELFNVTTAEINATSATQYVIETVQPEFILDATDRLVIKYYAYTTTGSSINVSLYYEGTAHYSYVITPISFATVLINDYIYKWDTTTAYYRPYTDKTEAGGVASSGKFYSGTSNPTATNRLNYDGNFHATNFVTPGTITSSGNLLSLVLNTSGTTATAGYFDSGTTNPSSTNRLNYGGYLYATKLYSGGLEVLTSTGLTFTNGLTLLSSNAKLGGTLTEVTTIDLSTFNLTFSVSDLTYAGQFSITGSGGSQILCTYDAISFAAGSSSTNSFTISNTGETKYVDNRVSPTGIEYDGDYSATYTDRSLADWGSIVAYASPIASAYSALTDAATIIWDCSTGLNKTVSIATSRILSITEMSNGMSGDLILTVSSGTPTLTLPASSRLNGSVSSLAAGVYHLCWTYSTVFDFNIALYE